MGRKSSITRLDPRIREAVDAAVRDGRATIEEIVAMIAELGGEASRSAVGRYVQRASAQMEKYRQAQEVAKTWIGKLESEPDGDVARLLPEMLRVIAFQYLADQGEAEKPAKAMDIMLLGKAMDHMAHAEKTSTEKTLRLRKEVESKLTKLESESGKKGKLDMETLKRVREEVYGIF